MPHHDIYSLNEALNGDAFLRSVRKHNAMRRLDEISVHDKYEKEAKEKMSEAEYRKLCALDPTTKGEEKAGQYCSWLLRMVSPDMLKDRDLCERIRVSLEHFDDGKRHNLLGRMNIPTDINTFKTLDTFLNAMEGSMNNSSDIDSGMTGAELKRLDALQGQYEIVGESPNWYVVNPQTYEAERHFGSGTSWCTVGNKDYFDYYTMKGPLYITIPKDKTLMDKRMQFHFGDNSFADVDDNVYDNPKECIDKIVGEGDAFDELCNLWGGIDKRFGKYRYVRFSDVPRLLAQGVSSKDIFDYVGKFYEGLATVKLGRKWNFIDKDGMPLSEQGYDEVHVFSEGLAAVMLDGKWNFINTDGVPQFKQWYDGVWNFSNGLAEVKLGREHYYIDKDGNYYDEATRQRIPTPLDEAIRRALRESLQRYLRRGY